MASSEYAEDEVAIQVSNVYKEYGHGRHAQKVLKGINMDVPYHSIYALLGASGCGKTTLLRCCLGYLRQNSGVITVMGNYPNSRCSQIPGRELGYVPQDIGLVSQFSIMETMYFVGVMFNMGFKQIRQRAEFLRNLLELPPLTKHISEMSGGEQRCVSFAVSLIQEPSLLIMDEPTVGMDSLLRQRIWQYIGELTVANQCTVVITTHYIDEARRANTVGLMRGGKLLIQANPEYLIRTYNAVTLEEVFVKLAYKQVADEEDMDLHTSTTVDPKKSIQADVGESDVNGPHVDIRKKVSPCDVFLPRFFWGFHPAIIIAIALKTTIKSLRNFGSLLFLLFIPITTAIAFIYFIGRDIRDVKLYYYSGDTATHPEVNRSYAELFIDGLTTSNRFDAEQASSPAEARNKVEDGDAYFAVNIGAQFSDALHAKYRRRCEPLVYFKDDPNYVDFSGDDVINTSVSSIHLSVDAADAQILDQGMVVLKHKGQVMLDTFFSDLFNASAYQMARPPVLLKRAVFGSLDWEYSDFIGSAILIPIVFLNSIALTAMAFVVERKEGLFERVYSAGASVTDFVVAYSLHASIILMTQVIILLLVVFAIFEIEMEGNVFLYGLILWMTSMLSAGCGLLLSSQVTSEMGVQNISQMIAAICVFLCGALWPLNGQPVVVRWFSRIAIPATWPSGAASAIGAKGLGLGDEPVYVGYIVTFGWILVIYFLAIAFFRTE